MVIKLSTETNTTCDTYGCRYNDQGVCHRCGDYDEDYDEDLEDDDEDDEDEGWVDKNWNGRRNAIEVELKWLDRAKELIREHRIINVEDAYTIVPILEREAKCSPFDEDIAKTMVVALRETKDEREAMAMADVPEIPDETTGGKGLMMLRAIALREKKKREAFDTQAVCMIPDCGCSGAAHP